MAQQKDPQENIRSFTDRVDKEIEADIRKLKRTSSILALMGTVVVLLVVAMLLVMIDKEDAVHLDNPLIVIDPHASAYAQPDPQSEKAFNLKAGEELIGVNYEDKGEGGWYRAYKENSNGTGSDVLGWIREDQVISQKEREQRLQSIHNIIAPVKIYDEKTTYDPEQSPVFRLEGRFRNETGIPLSNVRLIVTFIEKKTAETTGDEGPLTLPPDMTDGGREASQISEQHITTEKAIPSMITRDQIYFTDQQLPANGSLPFSFETELDGTDIEFKRWDIQVTDYPVKISINPDSLVYDESGYFKIPRYTLSNLSEIPLSNIKVTASFEDPESKIFYMKAQTVCKNNPLKKGVDRAFLDFEGLVERAKDKELAENDLVWKGVRVLANPIEIYSPRWTADEIGNFTLFANLRNNTNLPVENVKVKVNFFDQNRELLDYKYSYFATSEPLVPGIPLDIDFRGTFTREYRYKSLRVENFK